MREKDIRTSIEALAGLLRSSFHYVAADPSLGYRESTGRTLTPSRLQAAIAGWAHDAAASGVISNQTAEAIIAAPSSFAAIADGVVMFDVDGIVALEATTDSQGRDDEEEAR